jgi:acetyltransferase-like isoleucine patch superfamily enzyme
MCRTKNDLKAKKYHTIVKASQYGKNILVNILIYGCFLNQAPSKSSIFSKNLFGQLDFLMVIFSLVNLGLIVKNQIGPRTFYKSFQAHSITIGGRQFGRTLIDGKTKLTMSKNAQIINNGYLKLGLDNHFLPSTQPCRLTMAENSKLVINGTVNIAKGAFIEVQKNANLELNDNVPINANVLIVATNSIKIGERTGIGWDVEICDTAFHQIGDDPNITAPIQIGSHVLITSHCRIMKGVKIGDGAVIAMGSIVTRDIPPGCLAGGVPAKVIKQNIEWK